MLNQINRSNGEYLIQQIVVKPLSRREYYPEYRIMATSGWSDTAFHNSLVIEKNMNTTLILQYNEQ